MSDFALEEIQRMSREDFVENFPNDSPRWREIYSVSAEKLIRAIILAAKKVEWPEDGEQRGVREFWYNPVKPLLLRAVGERAHGYLFYTEKILSQLVKAGKLTYLDLGIRDFRTLREIYEIMEQAGCWSDVLLFVEKDSAYVHLVRLARLLNINMISGHGWSNTAGIEKMLRELLRKGIKDVEVFTLTDYDPFGFAIDAEFLHKCSVLGLSVVSNVRIAIKPEHATPEILDVQKYPIKLGRKLTVEGVSFNANEWLEEHGIEGRYGLEIEAISGQPGGPQKLREIVAAELLKCLDEEDRLREIREPLWRSTPETAVNTFLGELPLPDYEPENIPLPSEYLTEKEYAARKDEIEGERDDASQELWNKVVGINRKIEELTSELEATKKQIHEEIDEVEEPYNDDIEDLEEEYRRSRALLRRALMRWFEKNQDKWKKEEYDMNLPLGSLLKAVKESKTIDRFIAQASNTRLVKAIAKKMAEAKEQGEIDKIIEEELLNE